MIKDLFSFGEVGSFFDDFSMFAYTAKLKNAPADSIVFSTGVSLNKNEARLKAVGELIERFSQDENNVVNRIWLDKITEYAVETFDLHRLFFFENNENFRMFTSQKGEATRFMYGWNKDGISVPVPAQFFLFPYTFNDDAFYLSSTAGAAFYFDFGTALELACNELLERHLAMQAWMGLQNLIKIKLEKGIYIKSKKIGNLIDRILDKGLNIDLYLVNSKSFPVFVVIAVVNNINGNYKNFPIFATGLSCSLSLENAVEKSLLECVQIGLATIFKIRNKNFPKGFNENQLEYFNKHRNFDKVSSFFNSLCIKNSVLYDQCIKTPSLVEAIKHADVPFFYTILETEQFKKYGFVVKVFSPELTPWSVDIDILHKRFRNGAKNIQRHCFA